MSSNKHAPTKDELLHELESLRLQLQDSDIEHDIPILLDKVEHAISAAPEANPARIAEDTTALRAAYRDTAVKPVEDPSPSAPVVQTDGASTPATPLSRPAAHGENPFLPKHIRDRLSERRQTLAEGMAQVSPFFPAKPQPAAPRSTPATDFYQDIVDDLVAEYLPRLEKELRARLLEYVRENHKPDDPDT